MEHTTQPVSPTAPQRPVIAGLLLAAGGGRRLGGRPKALLEAYRPNLRPNLRKTSASFRGNEFPSRSRSGIPKASGRR